MKYLYILFIFLLNFSVYSQKQLEEANKLHDRHLYVDAATEYELYLDKAENVAPETYMNIGDTYYNLKDFNKAKEAYEKLWAIDKPRKKNNR